MDELKLLIEMVSNLPSLAVWVLVGYLVYKVVVIGSIYGLARFGIDKLHDWLTKRKTEYVRVETQVLLDGFVISDTKERLMAQLRRAAAAQKYKSDYIHDFTVDWLSAAIDDKIAKDQSHQAA